MALDLSALFPSSDFQLIEQFLKEHNYDEARVISMLMALDSERKCAPVNESASLVLQSDSYIMYSKMFCGILSDENVETIWVESQYAPSSVGETEVNLLTRAVFLALDCIESGLVEDLGTKYLDPSITSETVSYEPSAAIGKPAKRLYVKELMFSSSDTCLHSEILSNSPELQISQDIYENFPASVQYWANVQKTEYTKMAECFSSAARSHHQGNRETRWQAVVYAEKGREHERKMAHARTMYCKSLFESLNYPYVTLKINADKKIEIDKIKMTGRLLELDFHGIFVKEALELLLSLVSTQKREVARVNEVLLIVGRGVHSAKHICKIKVAFESFLSRQNYKYSINEGCILLKIL